MVGKPLLIASSALASLGDAMFGYSQGIMASNAVQPGFLKTIFGVDVTLEQIRDSSTGIDPWLFGSPFYFSVYFLISSKLTPWPISYHCFLPQHHCPFLLSRISIRV
jgi:hypothetical protein